MTGRDAASERELPTISWFGRLPEPVRLAICKVLRPVVFPVHDFVERWYHTDESLRLARIRGTILWWQLADAEPPIERPTAEALLDELDDYADRRKPLPSFRSAA